MNSTKTKQNIAIETVLTKLYSQEMVTKNKPKCEEWILRVAQCAVSTAVLAASFKFSQTKEVLPIYLRDYTVVCEKNILLIEDKFSEWNQNVPTMI